MYVFCLREKDTRNENSNAGFTLLELIIVLVLIGLLLVVTVPTLRNSMIDDPLRSTGRKLIGYVSEVRGKAIREQQSYLLFLDLDENRIWSYKENEIGAGETAPPEKGVFQIDASVNLADLWTKSQGSISSGVAEIWVSRQGYLDKMLIHLINDDGESLSMKVSPFLPAIEVVDGYHEPE